MIRFILFLAIPVLVQTFVFGQSTPQLQVQIGHQHSIKAFDISQSGKNLVSADSKGIIKVWDIKSGRVVKTMTSKAGTVKEVKIHKGKTVYAIRHHKTIRIKSFRGKLYSTVKLKNAIKSIDFGPSNLFVYSTYRGIYVKDYKADSLITQLKFKNSTKRAFFLNDSLIIYTQKKSVHLWDYLNIDNQKNIDITSINAKIDTSLEVILDVDHSNKRIIINQSEKWMVFDFNFNLISESEKVSSENGYVEIKCLNDSLVYQRSSTKSSYFFSIYNINNYSTIDLLPDRLQNGNVLSHKAYPLKLFYRANKNIVSADLLGKDSTHILSGIVENKTCYNLIYSADNNKLIYNQAYGLNRIEGFDLSAGKITPPIEGNKGLLLNIKNEDWLLSTYTYQPREFHYSRISPPFLTGPVEFKNDINNLEKIFYFPKQDAILGQTDTKEIIAVGFKDDSFIIKSSTKINDNETLEDVSESFNILCKALDEKNNPVYVQHKDDFEIADTVCGVFNAIVKYIPGTDEIIVANTDSLYRLSSDLEILWVKKNDKTWRYWDCIEFNLDTTAFALGANDGYIRVHSLIDGSVQQKGRRVHHSSVNSIVFINNNRIASSGRDGFIIIGQFVDRSYKKLVTILPLSKKNKLYAKSEKSYLFYTPEGYYYAQNMSPDDFHFVLHNKVYSYDQFDLKYNRPDIVLDRLNGETDVTRNYKKAYIKRLEKLGYSEALMTEEIDFPELSITNRKSIPSKTIDKELKIKVKATSGQRLKFIHLWVNGVAIDGENGIEIPDEEGKTSSGELDVILTKGKNVIQIAITNEGGIQSYKETVEVFYEGEEKKSDLYFVGLGIKKFRDSDYNLDYSDKDIRDIVGILSENKDTYQNIYIDTFINEQVTKNCLNGLHEKLLNTKPNDVVIIYYSGHGLLDDEFNYYLSTYDVVFETPQIKGLPYNLLEEVLDSIPARNKTILLDACHSGELDRTNSETIESETATLVLGAKGDIGKDFEENDEVQSFALMKDLFSDIRRSTGTNVIASSSGIASSFEDDKFKNGAFTYSLKEALNGKADLNRDKSISISELKQYLVFRVNELTNGDQTPTVRIENTLNDFRVW